MKPIEYSTLQEQLHLNTPKALGGESGDGLAALTHWLQLRDPHYDNYFNSSTKNVVQRFNEVALSRLTKKQAEQLPLPGLLGKPYESATVRYDVPFPPPRNPKFRFIDLFAGIGGMRIAFQNLGGQCVFSSEIDPFAKQTYQANFGEVPFGDITRIEAEDIPDHDILVGGFPCQAFSIAGKRLGFEEARGTLFYDIARILDAKRPRAFLLENVKGLMNHRGGETLRVILKILRDDLKYYVPDPQIVNAKFFGVPQNRERVIIVGFASESNAKAFRYPEGLKKTATLSDVLERDPVPAKYYISSQYYQALKNHRARHESKGHGFGFEILNHRGVSNAIVVGGMGRERNLIVDPRLKDRTPTTRIVGEVNSDNVRRLTPREWARLQGFPEEFIIPVSDAQAYKQFGNSVAVPAIESVAKGLVKLEGIK